MFTIPPFSSRCILLLQNICLDGLGQSGKIAVEQRTLRTKGTIMAVPGSFDVVARLQNEVYYDFACFRFEKIPN